MHAFHVFNVSLYNKHSSNEASQMRLVKLRRIFTRCQINNPTDPLEISRASFALPRFLEKLLPNSAFSNVAFPAQCSNKVGSRTGFSMECLCGSGINGRKYMANWGEQKLCKWSYENLYTIYKNSLVGGFNPSEKYYCSEIGSFPHVGVKMKKMSCHHLEHEQLFQNPVGLMAFP